MKKQTWIEIIVVLALVAGWFYMEKTESLTIFVKEDMTKVGGLCDGTAGGAGIPVTACRRKYSQ